jgi:3-oxoacyl-[acyl-carrier-protein] synthase-3
MPRAVLDEIAMHLPEKVLTDFLVLHQASKFTIDELVRKLKFPRKKAPCGMEDGGNTVFSTIPFVPGRLARRGELRSGHRVMLAGFGAGCSWAGGILTWK